MQEVTADKDSIKGSSEQQQQDNNNGGGSVAAQKTMVLPKKRPLAGQPATGTATTAGQQTSATVPKKQAKASGDEAVDDETLIRETEAALKSLSGGWPGARHSFYRTGHDDDRYESPAFVNLFDEKKIGTGSSAHPQPPAATRVDENKNNTGDEKPAQQQPPQQQRRDLDHILLNKIDQNNKDCEHNKKPDKYAPSKYEPDFNELVDDSSDELEIDMSADGGGGDGGCSGGDDKGDGGVDDDDDVNGDGDDDESGGSGRGRGRSGHAGGDRLRRKMDVDRRNNNSHVRPNEMMTSLKSESESSSYDAYLMDKTAFSAFRPVASGGVGEPKDPTRLDLPTAVGAAMSPLGPYPPAGATFVVGYTVPGGGLVSGGVSAAPGGGHGSPAKHLLATAGNAVGGNGGSVTPVKPVCVKLEDEGCSNGAADCKADGAAIKMDSPSPLSKQYTILQPAGADSRAASALQDVAREGVLGASVVSAAGGDGLSPRMTSGGGTPKLLLDPMDSGLMLPGCMNNKGKQR